MGRRRESGLRRGLVGSRWRVVCSLWEQQQGRDRPSREPVWVPVVVPRPSWYPGNRSAARPYISSKYPRCGISRIAWRRLFRQLVGGLSGQYGIGGYSRLKHTLLSAWENVSM